MPFAARNGDVSRPLLVLIARDRKKFRLCYRKAIRDKSA
jgi:hypothetical protein